MALTPREIEIIKEISRRQDQFELAFAGLLGGPLGRGFVMLDQEVGRRGFLLNQGNEATNLFAAEIGKEAGLQTRVKINKAKRKVSGYQKEFGRQMKGLIKKHPRTPRTKLMSKAHRLTKKIRKGK